MKRASLITSTLFLAALLVALLAVPAAWAQGWPATDDSSQYAQQPSSAPQDASVNVGADQIVTPVTDTRSRRERRDRRVARQTGIDTSQPAETAAVNEASGSLMDDQIRSTDYNDVASQLTEPSSTAFNELTAMAEDRAFACDGYGGLDGLGSAGLIGDILVRPPDGQPVFLTDELGASAPSDDDDDE